MYVGAGLILINPRGEVLLVRDARSNRLGFPKGHPEKKDKDIPLNTAIRECWEETGLTIGDDYSLESNKPKRIGKRLYFSGVCCRESFDESKVNKAEISEIGWWSLAKLGQTSDADLNSDLRSWLKKLTFISSPACHPFSVHPSTL